MKGTLHLLRGVPFPPSLLSLLPPPFAPLPLILSPSLPLSLSPTLPPSPHTETSVNVPQLRQQQIRLGLLKAARVLFSQQENLRQIMSRPAGSEDEQFSLFQQLLSAATRPSPIKAMFSRNELEVKTHYLVGLVVVLFLLPLYCTYTGSCCVSVSVSSIRGT